jgi:hypothetical protein
MALSRRVLQENRLFLGVRQDHLVEGYGKDSRRIMNAGHTRIIVEVVVLYSSLYMYVPTWRSKHVISSRANKVGQE